MSMLMMVQAVSFVRTVFKHKRKGIDAMIGDNLYRLGIENKECRVVFVESEMEG